MTAMGHEDQFPLCRLNARCVIREETFAGTHGNGRDAPIAAIDTCASKPVGPPGHFAASRRALRLPQKVAAADAVPEVVLPSRSTTASRRSIVTSSNMPASDVVRPQSKVKCTGLPATGGKPGKIPVLSSMRAPTPLA
jgi:hypothetical protein